MVGGVGHASLYQTGSNGKDALLEEIVKCTFYIMEENTGTIMPGLHILQKAQPITLAHHMGAILRCLKAETEPSVTSFERMNYFFIVPGH